MIQPQHHHQDHYSQQHAQQQLPQSQPQYQQQRTTVRDERRQRLILQDRKSRSFDSSFEDRRQLPAQPAHHLAVDQRLPPPPTHVEDEDEHRARRRHRLQETQRKSRSLDVYEPAVTTDTVAAASSKAPVSSRLRRSSAQVTDELPERTFRLTRCTDISAASQDQRYATSYSHFCVL